MKRRRYRVFAALLLFLFAALACQGSVPGLAPVQPSPTPTPTPTATQTPTPTFTPLVLPTRIVSPTPRVTETHTLTPTFTPQATITPSFTPTDTPQPGSEPEACPMPAGGFEAIYTANPTVQDALGCPIGPDRSAPPVAWETQTALQRFEGGAMVWVSQLGWETGKYIYVLYNDGAFARYEDTWQEGQPESGGESPPAGRFEPVRGFGKVWREQAGVRDRLGWAVELEIGGPGQLQRFERGEMVYLSQIGQTYIFMRVEGNRWQMDVTPF